MGSDQWPPTALCSYLQVLTVLKALSRAGVSVLDGQGPAGSTAGQAAPGPAGEASDLAAPIALSIADWLVLRCSVSRAGRSRAWGWQPLGPSLRAALQPRACWWVGAAGPWACVAAVYQRFRPALPALPCLVDCLLGVGLRPASPLSSSAARARPGRSGAHPARPQRLAQLQASAKGAGLHRRLHGPSRRLLQPVWEAGASCLSSAVSGAASAAQHIRWLTLPRSALRPLPRLRLPLLVCS